MDITTEEKMYTKTQLKEKFGFTESIIKLIPITQEKTNPKYKCAPPMKLYSEETIQKFMQSEEYRNWYEKSKKTKLSAQKAVQTKIGKNEELVEKYLKTIKVIKIPIDQLCSLALNAKKDWYDSTGDWERSMFVDSADEQTKERWIVNYIRHNLTSYDEGVDLILGKVGKDKLYMNIENQIMGKIAEVYPEYTAEIQRQLERKGCNQ